jgi:hypothetical protein
VTHVRLDGNELSDTGALGIAIALHGHTQLRALSLECNPIGDDGAAALLQVRRCCPGGIRVRRC